MTTGTYRYALDPTGTNPDNLVVNEVHTINSNAVRACAPTNGAYYTESIIVYDEATDMALVKNTDYQCVELLQDATLRFGKEICVLVLITNPNVSTQIRLAYQVVGGEFQYDGSTIINLYETAIKDDRSVDWVSILNKPIEYPPSLHRHLLEDVYGFEPVVAALERIRNAIALSDIPAFEAAMEWVTTRIDEQNALLAQLTALWQTHLNVTGNPHHLTKTDLNLDQVENLPTLTLAEAQSTTPVRKFVTHDTLLEILTSRGL